jgi:hypothetical protein
MGARATITIYQSGCFPKAPLNLYTHWGGDSICETLANGLAKAKEAGRLNDDSYATRIIFDTLTDLDGGTTGFGIIVGDHDDVNYVCPVVLWDHPDAVTHGWQFTAGEPIVVYGEMVMSASSFIELFADKSVGEVVVA